MTPNTTVMHVPDGHIAIELHDATLPSFRIADPLHNYTTAVVTSYFYRLGAAIKAAGYHWPHMTVVIRPSVKLEQTHDLAIALGVLIASGQIKPTEGHHLGCLRLDGTIVGGSSLEEVCAR